MTLSPSSFQLVIVWLFLLFKNRFVVVDGFAVTVPIRTTTTFHRFVNTRSSLHHPHEKQPIDRHVVTTSESLQQRRRYASTRFCSRSSLFSSSFEELAAASAEETVINSHSHQQQQLPPQQPELWLDLRGTALSPSEAIAHLRELLLNYDDDDDDDDDNYDSTTDDNTPQRPTMPLILSSIQHVLVSPEKIFRSSSGTQQQQRQYNDDDDDNHEVYYVTDDHRDPNYQLLVQSRHDKSFPIGKVISIQDDTFQSSNNRSNNSKDDASFYWNLNPLLAMETVSQGEWYLVDCHSAAWTSSTCTLALTSLLDMVTLAASADATSLPRSTSSPLLGLFESYDEPLNQQQPHNEDEDDNQPATTGMDAKLTVAGNTNVIGGGLALTCPTAEALWQAASLFVQQDQQGRSHMTNSGILVPTAETVTSVTATLLKPTSNQLETSSRSISTTARGAKKAISLALVLPFDAGLWWTAATLLTTTDAS
jgi:hypothetical protein